MKKGLWKFSVSILALSYGGLGYGNNATAQEIFDLNKLNNLTGKPISWSEATSPGENTVFIDGKYYQYQYNKYDDIYIFDEANLPSPPISNVGFYDQNDPKYANLAFEAFHPVNNLSGLFLVNNNMDRLYDSDLSSLLFNSYDAFPLTGSVHSIGNKFTANVGAGVFYNEGAAEIINSSFINNSFNGTDGAGAILNMGGALHLRHSGDLYITANNGYTLFSGNYIEKDNGDGTFSKTPNDITSVGGSLYISAFNNGIVRFDDGILGIAHTAINISGGIEKFGFEQSFSSAQEAANALGITVEELGDKYEYAFLDRTTKQGAAGTLTKQNDGTYLDKGILISNIIPENEIDYFLDMALYNGVKIRQDGDNYILTFTGADSGGTIYKHTDGNYYLTYGNILYSEFENSGQVIFNAPIEFQSDDGIVDIVNQTGNTNVYFGSNSTIKGYTYNITGGTLNNATVDDGGTLTATDTAKIINLLALDGSTLDLATGTTLTGNIKISASANLQGGYNYNSIFADTETTSGSLTLVGGINKDLKDSSLVNTSEDKSLVLSSGDFEIGTGTQEVSGWKEFNVVDNAMVKLVGDANNESYIHSEKLNLLKNSTLDLAGNSPLIATIDSSVNNDGLMTFTHDDLGYGIDGADDHITIKGNYRAFKNAEMIIDVDVANSQADVLTIEGDVVGRTRVVINTVNDDGNNMAGKALFVEAPNDDPSTGAYFDVFRKIADARVWNSLYENNQWFVGTENTIATSQSGYGTVDDDKELILGDPDNDDNSGTGGSNNNDSGNAGGNTDGGTVNITTGKPQVYAETIAYMALPTVGLEQIRDLTKVVTNKVASTKYKCADCGVYDHMYNGRPLNNAWVDMSHRKADLEAPADVEAKINAVDLGFDVQSDPYNRLGVFASYRQGDYELSGEGQDYYSKTGSEYNIDSWALGLYHRYDRRHLWTMASVFGGLQQVDLTTDDGVSADTDGLMFGANIEAGMVFEPKRRLTLEPSIRLGYNFIKYDDMSDRYGKTAEYDNISNLEAELGVKIEKSWIFGRRGIAKLFVKPSVIQNIGSGDVNITSLDAVEGIDNQTLLRGEIGMSIAGDNGLSGFATVGHTFGSDYKSTDFNAGLGYSW